MRRTPTLAGDRLRSVQQRRALEAAFLPPVSVKVDKIHIVCIVKVNAGAHHPLKLHRPLRTVAHYNMARHSSAHGKHRVEKRDLRAAYMVFAEYFQRIRFDLGSVCGRLSRELRFTGIYFV